MGYVILLAITTCIGAAIGQFCPDVPHPVIGGLIGFIVGAALSVGDSDSVIDVLSSVDWHGH